MRWWRGIGLGLIFVGLVQPGCGGRSSNVEQEGESGSAQAGRAGTNAGRSSGSGGSQAGRDDVVPGTGGSILLPQGGDAGRGGLAGRAGFAGRGGFAGKGGSPGAGGFAGEVGGAGDGGVGGEPACPCSDFCEESVEAFCHTGGAELGCPIELEAARHLDDFCDWDAEDLVYSECDGVVTIEYIVGGEEAYELAFSAETETLVYGYASVYAGECNSEVYRAGSRPDTENCRSCRYCGEFGEGGEVSALPTCQLDWEGRFLSVPNDVCECTGDECVVPPDEFCPPDLPFPCPLTLSEARRADALCRTKQDSPILYGECDGDIAFTNWSTSEGEVTLAFSLESGELVHGSAKLYAYDYCDEAASPSARIETDGQFEPSSCRTCDLTDYCAGEDVATIDCLVDGEGRVTLPD